MARIRSTHPGQWTDEDFLTCSMPARLLCIAIRNEADDHGVFEWKPVPIKLKLLPIDNVDVSELLQELVENKQITQFEEGGRTYGVIKNFRKFQRPKKPTYYYPFPDKFAGYIGLKTGKADDDNGDGSSELDEDKAPPGTEPDEVKQGSSTEPDPPLSDDSSEVVPELPEHKKEEGGRREEEGGSTSETNVSSDSDFFDEFRKAYPSRKPHQDPKAPAQKKFFSIIKSGVDPGDIIEGAKRFARHVRAERPDPRFIPQAQTWLNQRRWEDELEKAETNRVRPWTT